MTENFKLKWVECKQNINYQAFREGEQLVNHIPNCGLLTNKLGLLNSLQSFDRVTTAVKKSRQSTIIKSYLDFTPETFRVDDMKEREKFFQEYKEGDIWICKPTGTNQGKGIFLVRDLNEFRATLVEYDEKKKEKKAYKPTTNRIIQRYVANPLLLDGKKFDLRAYMLISSTSPLLVLYAHGYVRLSLAQYDNDTTNLVAHLTNQYIQKKDPAYKDVKEDTVWSFDKLNDYVNRHVAPGKEVENDWVKNGMTKTIKSIMVHLIKCVQNRLAAKVGYFDLYGLDFMIDENLKVWFIEANVNPALATNCGVLKDVIPGVVDETLRLSIECFEKSKRNVQLLPLKNLKTFEVIYSETKNRLIDGPPIRQPQQSLSPKPNRRSRSLSPGKEMTTIIETVPQTLNTPQKSLPAKVPLTVPSLRGVPPGMERSPYAASDSIRFRLTHAQRRANSSNTHSGQNNSTTTSNNNHANNNTTNSATTAAANNNINNNNGGNSNDNSNSNITGNSNNNNDVTANTGSNTNVANEAKQARSGIRADERGTKLHISNNSKKQESINASNEDKSKGKKLEIVSVKAKTKTQDDTTKKPCAICEDKGAKQSTGQPSTSKDDSKVLAEALIPKLARRSDQTKLSKTVLKSKEGAILACKTTKPRFESRRQKQKDDTRSRSATIPKKVSVNITHGHDVADRGS
ncbi:unnamed protein product [Dimorphilus gyrociliatus]|uniref:ATP-grasp domain-containing protein n=1 Tax=Dimorphilus gyrociliatus TaxID=2664684 RepID=A0A7I8VTI4_9ANNE|nr:unnamed protein product [Dimorphilus gyrociliatus]